MLRTSDVVTFVTTTKPERARAFYEGVLGLRLMSDDPFALVFDVHGIMLRVSKAQAFTPAPHTVLGWKAVDIADTVAARASPGSKIRMETCGRSPSSEPVMATTGGRSAPHAQRLAGRSAASASRTVSTRAVSS